jgi:Fic family protein
MYCVFAFSRDFLSKVVVTSMKLPPPNLVLDKVSNELIQDALRLAQKVNEFRPLSPDLLDKVQKDLLGERVYNSNAIEGSTLTLRETRLVLQTGSGIDVSRRREAQEALNLAKAFEQIQDSREAAIDQSNFLDVHRLLFRDVNAQIGGIYRNQGVLISGAKHQPPDSSRVPDLMDEFFDRLKSANVTTDSAIQIASWAQWCISRIHPFFDGNGRMARLWQDLVLFQGKLTAAVIRLQERSRYYDCLTAADDGDLNPLVQLVAQSVNMTMQLYINAYNEVDSIKGWAASLVDESDTRSEEQRKLEYTRWKLRMEEVRDAFERCAAQLTNASDGRIDVQVKSFPIIDQATWDSLRSGEGASRTWFFWLNCRRDNRRIGYCFFFGKHLWSPADRSIGAIPPSVCLLISEQDGRDDPVLLDSLDASPISTREILVLDGKLACRVLNNAGEIQVERDSEAVKAAQAFLQEVLLKRLI